MDMGTLTLPQWLIKPIDEFATEFSRLVQVGRKHLAESRVVFTGLARNCAAPLAGNLAKVEEYGECCGEWRCHVETNDNVDTTVAVLEQFAAKWPQASFRDRTLNRQQFGAEFAGPRTQALAEYRTSCQEWAVKQRADIVVVVDFDAWGGCPPENFFAAIGQFYETPDAYGMAAVSLFEADMQGKWQWMHYDCWALRLNSYWDDYTAGVGGWKYGFLPPVGSAPIPVRSAFGGMAIYDPVFFGTGVYDGSDCEHVTFHKSVAARSKLKLYLCPSLRMLMHWNLNDATHSADSV